MGHTGAPHGDTQRNRTRFIAQAELVRQRRERLLRSLKNPHPEAAEMTEGGLADWAARLPSEDDGLVDVETAAATLTLIRKRCKLQPSRNE